jgi:zinc/manganese transport system substrate-binding protein
MKKSALGALVATPLVAAIILTGCSSTGGSTADSGKVQVVASTNVYGDIAAQVGGDNVEVTSLITSAAQDPHSYEASAQDRLAVSRADVVMENGGGYDPFVDTLLEAGSTDGVVVINASELSGLMPGHEGSKHDHEHEDEASSPTADANSTDAAEAKSTEAADEHEGHDHIEGFNEHVWYSFQAMDEVAHELAHELGEKDAANAEAYEKNYEAFSAQLKELEASAEALKTKAQGKGAAITEPVPLYLLEEAGLQNKTPDAFSEAIEEGTDVSPSVLQETLAIFSNREVALLAYNEQTSGPETAEVEKAAKDAGIPVVSFTETMPEGDTYVSWMTANITAISDVLQ